ncbi:MAG: hypothetical protein BWX47_00423 [candidate division Hyd24-12 bacterium ADurb.Bin004]|nr:MAG: hypothetical protein BWX47_00423 [candidate division Hyd24-12 bacterium ADurb.Bin004]
MGISAQARIVWRYFALLFSMLASIIAADSMSMKGAQPSTARHMT